MLDIDTTDVALHGKQEGHFFHGYYDHYCYLPLYVFSGEHLLCVRLAPRQYRCFGRKLDRDPAHGRENPAMLAAGADHLARRLGLLSRRVDELVRRQWSELLYLGSRATIHSGRWIVPKL